MVPYTINWRTKTVNNMKDTKTPPEIMASLLQVNRDKTVGVMMISYTI